MWIDAAQRHFHGSVVLGKDLLVILSESNRIITALTRL